MPSTSGDDERDPEPVLAQPAAEAVRAVLDRQRAIHDDNRTAAAQPYQAGTVSQVRAARRSARRAASAWRR